MKNLLLLVITFFSFQLINAQEQTSQLQDTIYDFKEVDIKPEYPGGVEAFYKFIAKNFKAPEEEGLNGKIITTFVIEIDGSITDIKVLQDIGYGSGAEVFKVLEMSKKWIPAKLNDVPVRVLYQFPITIRSAEKYPKKPKQ
ncbi:MAG TPA: energy transducer TonB [Flavobacterium sp.]|nr:energy transducer TonB [Flavobacterium sp.]